MEPKTTVSDFVSGLERLLLGDFAVAETPVSLLSRDGETLRAIEEVTFNRNRNELRISGSPEELDTWTLGELLSVARCAPQDSCVRLLADGFGDAHWADMDSFKLAPEIINVNHLDFTDNSVVLCT